MTTAMTTPMTTAVRPSMTTLTGHPLDPPGPPATGPGASPHPPAADRGELVIADQVVQKIGAAALTDVDGIGGAARRVLGVALGSDDPEGTARVAAHVDGGLVTLHVTCSVAYPRPVREVTERARAHLIERVGALTGLRVAQVDITVTALTSTTATGRRELL